MSSFTALVFLIFPRQVAAFQFKSQDNFTLDSRTILNESLVVSGKNLTIQGKIDGDLICAGQDITVSASVTGDIICAGQNITVTAPVGGNLRLAGQTLNLDAKVAKNVTIFGQSISYASASAVLGESLIAGQKIDLAVRLPKIFKLGLSPSILIMPLWEMLT